MGYSVQKADFALTKAGRDLFSLPHPHLRRHAHGGAGVFQHGLADWTRLLAGDVNHVPQFLGQFLHQQALGVVADQLERFDRERLGDFDQGLQPGQRRAALQVGDGIDATPDGFGQILLAHVPQLAELLHAAAEDGADDGIDHGLSVV